MERIENLPRQIILVGPRGAGKTTIGHALARNLDLPFYDTDRLVEEYLGEPIAQFWGREGEACFRKKESEIVRRIPNLPPGVVATGGGVVLDQDNRKCLRECGMIFYISLRPESLVSRLQNGWGVRPRLMKSLSLEEEVREVLLKREPIYKEVSDYIVSADGQGIPQVVQIILKHLANASGSTDGGAFQ
ncbi:MAG: shikimate kinase [Leptospirales bacterium]